MAIKLKTEMEILHKTPIIITTCKASNSHRLHNFDFERVIIDEAAQSQEIETLLTFRRAKQAVLIGDSKQLGPIYRREVSEECDSMLTRLVNSDYKHTILLTSQFRMNPALLEIPNKLVYDGNI